MRGGWVYIMTNKPRGLPYVGVTAHLGVDQHRHDRGSAFCRKYGLKRLVLAEWYDTIELIESANPDSSDLYGRLA